MSRIGAVLSRPWREQENGRSAPTSECPEYWCQRLISVELGVSVAAMRAELDLRVERIDLDDHVR
jgi:hypothetical protein